jgi:hypothetical protein
VKATKEEVTTTTVTLTMTLEEAKILHRVAQAVGGHPETTSRWAISLLSKALWEAGITPSSDTFQRDACALFFAEKE